jgi:LysR family transcriptional regulator, nitrogen assimilation regulatory protein
MCLSCRIGRTVSFSASLLRRSARAVKPTVAGERFYEQALSILGKLENLLGLVRSSIGEVEGLASVEMPDSLSTILVGPFIEDVGRPIR